MSPVRGLLCSVPRFDHTELPLASSVPQSWAGQSAPPEKGGHCSKAGLALLLVPFLRGFLPSILAGAALDLAITGFQPELPVLTTDPPRAAGLKLPAQNPGVSWKKRENTNTLTPKCGCLLLLGYGLKKEEQPLPCNASAAPIRDISRERCRD